MRATLILTDEEVATQRRELADDANGLNFLQWELDDQEYDARVAHATE